MTPPVAFPRPAEKVTDAPVEVDRRPLTAGGIDPARDAYVIDPMFDRADRHGLDRTVDGQGHSDTQIGVLQHLPRFESRR